MQFVYPQFLWAFGLLVIPVLVHLFNFRRYKKLTFTNVHLLKEVLLETRSRRNVRHWLVLLSRLLAFSALVMAFAQPYIPHNKHATGASAEMAVIYLDNSFSMETESERGPLIEMAKERAREIVSAYGQSGRFFLLTNSSYSARALSKDEVFTRIDEVIASSRFKSVKDIFRIAASLPHPSGTALYYISDMQEMTFRDMEPIEDSTYRVYLLPVSTSAPANLSLDSFWLDRPVYRKGEVVKGSVKMSNRSSSSREDVSLNMKLNGKTVSATAIDMEANSSSILELEITIPDTGWLEGVLEISDAPVSFDDRLYFTLRVRQETRILLIGAPESRTYLRKVYATDEHFRVDESTELAVDYSSLNNYTLIALSGAENISSGLSEALKSFVSEGGQLAIFPSEKENTELSELFKSLGIRPYASVVKESKEAGILDERHPVFEGVFEKIPQNLNAPQILKFYRATGAPMVGETYPLAMQGGDPLISVIEKERGRIFQCFTALNNEWGNFHKHALFVPLVLNMAIPGEGAQAIYWMTETPSFVPLESEQAYNQGDVLIRGGKNEWIPELLFYGGQTKISTGTEMTEAGVFSVVNNQKELMAKMALNFDRRESDMTAIETGSISENWIKGAEVLQGEPEMLRRAISEHNEGKRLWKWFVIAALVFLFIEIFLLRNWKSSLQPSH